MSGFAHAGTWRHLTFKTEKATLSGALPFCYTLISTDVSSRGNSLEPRYFHDFPNCTSLIPVKTLQELQSIVVQVMTRRFNNFVNWIKAICAPYKCLSRFVAFGSATQARGIFTCMGRFGVTNMGTVVSQCIKPIAGNQVNVSESKGLLIWIRKAQSILRDVCSQYWSGKTQWLSPDCEKNRILER